MPWSYYIKIVIFVIVVAILGYLHYRDKKAAVDAIEWKYTQQLLQEQTKARATEQKLNEDAVSLRNKKDEEISSINGKLSNAIRLLNSRKSRPANPPTAQVGATCTGAQLYREDAEFLAGEAARAEKVRIERDYYYERYERARRSLAGEKVDDGLQGKVSDSEPLP